MKTKVPFWLVISLTGFLISSCDPAIGYDYYLNNKSDKQLKVYYVGNGFNDTTKTLFVLPRTNILFYETEIWGKDPHDEKENFLQIFDTLNISPTDSSHLIKDFLKRENWTYSNEIGHNGFIETGTNIYRLEIVNDDFDK